MAQFEKIKPCPKCNGKAKIVYEEYHEEYHIECTECPITFGLFDDGEIFRGKNDKLALIEDWNIR